MRLDEEYSVQSAIDGEYGRNHEGELEFPCRIKCWAKQAGWFGTSFGAKFYPYPEQEFTVSLAGLE